jgi:acetyl esterase
MDPQVQALLDQMAAASEGAPAMSTLPAHVAREGAETTFAAFNSNPPEVARVEDRDIPGPAGEVPVRIYWPLDSGRAGRGDQASAPLPLVVYFHGGGWVIGSRNTHDQLCRELANGSGSVVVSVDYRLAPEHPAPASLDDCMAAIHWAVDNAANLGVDPQRFAIAGDSAGGNLAAAAAIRLRDEGGPTPKLQLLLYPVLDYDLTRPSYAENGEGKILTTDTMQWFWDHYLSGGADPKHHGISPLQAEDLSGLPPARIIVGTLDILRDEAVAYAERLEAAGVPVTLSLHQDMPHVFLQLSAVLDGGKRGVEEASAALREAVSA